MSLPTPVLDDRSYDQILGELTGRIAVYAPEWTDHGPSDPGITLLELLAHVSESMLYRFNQIPDQTRLWLLRLLQLSPYPPRRATGLVTFTAPRGAAEPPVVIEGNSVGAGEVPFRVGNDVTVLPILTSAVAKMRAAAPTDPILLEEYLRVLDVANLDESQAQPYEEFVLAPEPAAPGFVPLQIANAVDHSLWVAVHPAPTAGPDLSTQLFGASGVLGKAPLVLGFATDAVYPTIDEIDPCDSLIEPPEDLRFAALDPAQAYADPNFSQRIVGPELPGPPPKVPDSSLVWQVSVRPTGGQLGTTFLPVSVVRDTTDGLRRDGVVALQLPATELDRIGVGEQPDADLAGVSNDPPALADGPEVLFWLRAFPRQGAPTMQDLRWVGPNAADVEQVAQATPELLGVGDGLSQQELALAHRPVVANTLQVEVLSGERWQPWTVVDSFAASTATDRHLMLDPTAGRLRCGDSVRGQIFPVGAPIRAVSYRYGGGRIGSVKAGAIASVLDGPDVTVSNPVPTLGGEEGETISRALERIPGELTRHDRAVTVDDFRELAQIVGVSRAECLPRFDPVSRNFEAAGVVTVMIWPTEDPLHPDAPRADATLLRAVCQHLDRRRLVTTELNVIPATYHRVAVSVGLAVKSGYSALGVRRWAELVLRQYLSPLPPYGPEGHGWPIGHRVHGPELEAAVLQVEGVDFIEELKVADLASPTPIPGSVTLTGWEVPELREVTVVIGQPPEPGSGAGGGNQPSGPTPVPVPVPRDEC
jgi:hypothetical protein